MKLTETTHEELDIITDKLFGMIEHLNIHQAIYVVDNLRSKVEEVMLGRGRDPVDLFQQVSENVEVILDGQKYLLEKGDKISIL